MNNINELEERIKRIEEEFHHIDRLDGTTFELTERLNRAVGLLIRVVEKNEQIDKKDLDYLLLKLRVDADKHYEVPTIINRAAINYKRTGEYPTLYEIHQRIIEALSLTEKGKQEFSIEVTESLLKKYMNVEEVLPVCEKILSTK